MVAPCAGRVNGAGPGAVVLRSGGVRPPGSPSLPRRAGAGAGRLRGHPRLGTRAHGASTLTPGAGRGPAGVGGNGNREAAAELMVSVKTVGCHMGNVYTKLGLSSRSQLRRSLRRQEALTFPYPTRRTRRLPGAKPRPSSSSIYRDNPEEGHDGHPRRPPGSGCDHRIAPALSVRAVPHP